MRVTRQFTRLDAAVLLLSLLLLWNLAASGGPGRERARQSVCQVNLGQLGDAMELFLNDHEDRYPSPWAWLVKNEAPEMGYHRFCRWHDAKYPPDGPVWSYTAKVKIALCPTFGGLAREFGRTHVAHVESIPIESQFSYVMNAFLSRAGTFPQGVTTPAQITRSRAEVFVFAEQNMWPRPGDSMGMNDTALCGDGRDWFGTFHDVPREMGNSGTINAVFADGHVQKVRSALAVTSDSMADRKGAEYGVFEKFAWPLTRAPR